MFSSEKKIFVFLIIFYASIGEMRQVDLSKQLKSSAKSNYFVALL